MSKIFFSSEQIFANPDRVRCILTDEGARDLGHDRADSEMWDKVSRAKNIKQKKNLKKCMRTKISPAWMSVERAGEKERGDKSEAAETKRRNWVRKESHELEPALGATPGRRLGRTGMPAADKSHGQHLHKFRERGYRTLWREREKEIRWRGEKIFFFF